MLPTIEPVSWNPSILNGADQAATDRMMPGRQAGELPVTLAVDNTGREQLAGNARTQTSSQVTKGKACRTCAERKYKDESNDPSVSFQTPTSIAPGMEAAAVMAHEHEHVANNAARAEREGQTATSVVMIHTELCPECGRPFISGGTTLTTYGRKGSEEVDEDQRGVFVRASA